MNFPVEKYYPKKNNSKEMILCLPYDIKQIYAFMCRNYGNISYNEFLNMGYDEFSIKIGSIPENEPLFLILKSRAINISKLKDKEEKKYWREMKRTNAIPDIYKTNEEIEKEIDINIKDLGGIKNAI